ncbi:hypothetical protein PsYK624_014250 [Phanerochaete sordida]|uniref:DUF6533 domain-containing protein n=1 Tax=Phanerochaete sordida TaxID=48140 RepID=A0A9P3L7R5_9APHY|nr:hypothetical protein PsYK624_014250 [Phanerochaete sordida]
MSFDYDSEQLRSFQLSNYVGCSFAALIIYEYSITFGQEIETIWKRKVTVASGLVLVARWMLLLLAAACILTPTARGCTAAGNIVHVMFAVGYLPVNLFLSLRIFALWGRNWTLFTIVFVLGLAPSLTNSLGAADFTFAPFVGPVSACLDFLKPVYAANFNRNYTMRLYCAGRTASAGPHGDQPDMDQVISQMEGCAPGQGPRLNSGMYST